MGFSFQIIPTKLPTRENKQKKIHTTNAKSLSDEKKNHNSTAHNVFIFRFFTWLTSNSNYIKHNNRSTNQRINIRGKNHINLPFRHASTRDYICNVPSILSLRKFSCYALSRNWPFASLRWVSFTFCMNFHAKSNMFYIWLCSLQAKIFFFGGFCFLNFVTTYTWKFFCSALTWETSKNITPPHSVAVARCKYFFGTSILFEIEKPFHIRILQRLCEMFFFCAKVYDSHELTDCSAVK